MTSFKILLLLFLVIQPAYSDVQIIEWGTDYSKSDRADYTQSKVDIYVTSWCPYCRKAIAYLNAKGIKYNKFDIEKDMKAAARKRALAPNYRGIPLAVINGKVVKGFNKNIYKTALKR